MSRWIKSTSQRQWNINGKVVPKCITPNNSYLVVSEKEYTEMTQKVVFASLIKSGEVLVLKEEPAELKNNIEGLTSSNASLIAKNTELKEELKVLKEQLDGQKRDVDAEVASQVEAFKAEAIKELQEKQDALDKALAQIKDLKKQVKRDSE